jgi:hypothetical protein
MMKKILMMLGIGLAANSPIDASEFYKPYADSRVNFLYNLLFCDDIALFKNENNVKGDGLWPTLLADKPDLKSLQKIADDETNEGRVRAVAFNRLRASGRKVPSKKVMGVIVEVPQAQGLDVLAAFAEGGVRYLNQSGKMVIFEGGGHPVEALAKELVAVSQPVVNQIGPWDKKRLAPPKPGNVRMTFLVSDGLYFGEGPFDTLQKDPMGGPVLAKAAQLLQRAVENALK